MSANFGDLDDWEFNTIADIYGLARKGREVSAEASQIVLGLAADFKRECLWIPVTEGSQSRKANRASRPLRRGAMHLWAAQRCFNVLPRVFLKTYEAEIGQVKGQGKQKGITLK